VQDGVGKAHDEATATQDMRGGRRGEATGYALPCQSVMPWSMMIAGVRHGLGTHSRSNGAGRLTRKW
jgi:hypothetical protein